VAGTNVARTNARPSLLIFAVSSLQPVLILTELNAAKYFHDAGYNVAISYCRRALPVCMVNPFGEISKCLECQVQHGANASSYSFIKSIGFPRPKKIWKVLFEQFLVGKKYKNQKDIEQLFYNNLDMGMAVISNSFTVTAESDEIDVSKELPNLCDRLQAVFFAYLGALELIEKQKPDAVAFLTGRQSECRSYLRAAEKAGVEFYALEVGSDPANTFDMIRNDNFHSRHGIVSKINDAWKNASPVTRDGDAVLWFRNRREKSHAFNSNIANQVSGTLPEFCKTGKKLISIFSSTWREFACLDSTWRLPFGDTPFDQLQAISTLAKALGDDYQFVVRMHPNQASVPGEVAKFKSLETDYFRIIEPNNPCDSYKLIEGSYAIITFGSTVGIEATFWGRPSILAGPSWYSDYNVAKFVSNIDELAAALKNPQVYPRENTYPYGYYYAKPIGIPSKIRLDYYNLFDWHHRIKKYRYSLFNPNGFVRRTIKKLMGF